MILVFRFSQSSLRLCINCGVKLISDDKEEHLERRRDNSRVGACGYVWVLCQSCLKNRMNDLDRPAFWQT